MHQSSYSLDSMSWAEGTDIFNSEMYLKLRSMDKLTYTVRVDEDRIDLLCSKIYGNSNPQLISLLILLNGKNTFKVDEKVYYIELKNLRFT